MIETGAMIGGEESGGFAFAGHVPERDGILAGLYLLDFMVKKEMTPSELLAHLFDKVGKHYYKRIDTRLISPEKKEAYREPIESAQPETIAGLKVLEKITIDGYKFALEDGGWLLVRFSGTEPLIRVYCETTHADKVDDIITEGMRLAGITE
jgi:phosphomannomutase